MRLKLIVLVVLAAASAGLVIGFGAKDTSATKEVKTSAKSGEQCLKVGVVSVRKIFEDCKRNVRYRQEALAERDKMEAELEKLSRQIDVDKTGLKALKPGSADYLTAMKEILDKQGNLQVQQEYFKRQMDFREQAAIESVFKEVIKATAAVAKEKGLDLVLEKSEPDLPASNSNELTLTISTHKVLYSAGCDDITDAVLAKVDANSP